MTISVKQDVIEAIVGGSLPDQTLSDSIENVSAEDLRMFVNLIETYIDAADSVNEWIDTYLVGNLNSVNTKYYEG